ncbi:hypothetical protein BD779DRAFT_1487596 [Infundibulicybe gibba]|nr:hypothetical protein BD779DRAFT_1487596 [Infundibulicybe gibba]
MAPVVEGREAPPKKEKNDRVQQIYEIGDGSSQGRRTGHAAQGKVQAGNHELEKRQRESEESCLKIAPQFAGPLPRRVRGFGGHAPSPHISVRYHTVSFVMLVLAPVRCCYNPHALLSVILNYVLL